MIGRRLLLAGALLAAMAVTATCGDPQEPDGPTPGWVDIVLSSPNANDAGILFTVRGPAVDSVQGAFPTTFVRRMTPGSVRVLVIAGLSDGAVVGRVYVTDTADVSGYSADIGEVAGNVATSNIPGAPPYAQRAAAEYSLTIGAP